MITPDRPGIGRSDFYPWTFDDYPAELARFADGRSRNWISNRTPLLVATPAAQQSAGLLVPEAMLNAGDGGGTP